MYRHQIRCTFLIYVYRHYLRAIMPVICVFITDRFTYYIIYYTQLAVPTLGISHDSKHTKYNIIIIVCYQDSIARIPRNVVDVLQNVMFKIMFVTNVINIYGRKKYSFCHYYV